MKAYPEYKPSGIDWLGEIPSHWKVSKLKHYISISNGSDPSLDGNIPVYGTVELPFKTCGEFKEGPTVLLGRKGSIDTPHWVDGKYWNVDTAFDTKVIENYNMRYFWYLANIIDINPYKSTTAVPSMTQSAYDNMLIPAPSIEEQEVIAGYLDEVVAKVDSLIAEKQAQVEDLRKYRTSLITETVTRGLNPDAPLRPSGIDWLGDIPEHWKVIKMKHCVDISNGSDPKTEGSIPVYGSGATSFKTCGEYKYGPTVLIGRKGATLHIPHWIEGKYWNVDTAFDTRVKSNYSLRFFYYIACSFDYEQYKSQTTLPSMTQSAYENAFIPVPPISEQLQIADFLDEKTAKIDTLIEELEAQLSDLATYKQAVITEAVTGKVDVRDWTPKS